VFVVTESTDDNLTVEHRHIGTELTIPRDAVGSYFLRRPYRERLDVTELDEYTVIREFDGLDRFLSLVEETGIPDGWESYATEKRGHIASPETIDLTAPGSCHPVYYTEIPVFSIECGYIARLAMRRRSSMLYGSIHLSACYRCFSRESLDAAVGRNIVSTRRPGSITLDAPTH
jgi:hypothetical protein